MGQARHRTLEPEFHEGTLASALCQVAAPGTFRCYRKVPEAIHVTSIRGLFSLQLAGFKSKIGQPVG